MLPPNIKNGSKSILFLLEALIIIVGDVTSNLAEIHPSASINPEYQAFSIVKGSGVLYSILK
jgi:hypothetical protein